jgi:hypothetical protein
MPTHTADVRATQGGSQLVRRSAAAVPFLAAAALLAWGVEAGVPALHLVAALAVVLVTQVLPGAVVWRVVRPRHGWWAEDLGMGFAIGSVLALLAQIPAGLLGLWWLSAALVLGLTALLLAVPLTRRRVVGARTTPLPWWWGPALSGAFFVTVPQLRSYFHDNPLTWAAGVRAPHVDTYLHVALAAELQHRGPTTFPWVESEALGYHWFSHAWVAQVSATSGAGVDEVLMRVMPLLMPVVVSLSVAVAAMRLTGRAWSGPFAALLTMCCGSVNFFGVLTGRLPVTPLSPSLGISVPMLLGVVVLLVVRWRRKALPGASLVLLLLAVAATGTKGSTTPLVIAGLGVAAAAMLLFNRSALLRVLVDLGIVLGALVPVFFFVFRKSGAGLHLSARDAAGQTWAGELLGTGSPEVRLAVAALVLFAALTPVVLGLAALLVPRWRRDPAAWLLLGGSLAGAGALVVFAHPGHSQGYFALSALPLMALLATCGLTALVDSLPRAVVLRLLVGGAIGGPLAVWVPVMLFGPLRHEPRRAVAMFAVGALILLGLTVAGWVIGRGRRLVAAVALLGVAMVAGGTSVNWDYVRTSPKPKPTKVSIEDPKAISRDQFRAARWIRDHSDPDDLVMTNRHCVVPRNPARGCDSRRFVVTGLSERQVLLEGWTATPRSAKEGPEGRDSITVAYWDPELLELNDGFVETPTAEAADELRRRGVRWIFVDHTRPYAYTLRPHADLRFATPGVEVYELRAD